MEALPERKSAAIASHAPQVRFCIRYVLTLICDHVRIGPRFQIRHRRRRPIAGADPDIGPA
jgi:hypothetical protein